MSSSTLKMSLNYILAPVVGGGNPLINCVTVTFYIICHLSLAMFKIFLFIFNIGFSNFTVMFQGVVLFLFILLRICWASCICELMCSASSGCFQPLFLWIFFLICFFCPLLLRPQLHVYYTTWYCPIIHWGSVYCF